MPPSNDFPPGNGQPKQNDGKRPNDGPPDLDQMWRDFTARIGRMFGGKGGPGGFKPDSRGTGIGIAIISCIVLLIWVLSGYFVVPDGQVAVVTTFGKKSEHTVPPGVNWHWPYPMQTVELVNTSETKTLAIGSRKVTPEGSMLTIDQNIVGVELSVQYKIKNPADWLYNNSESEATIRHAAETALRETVGRNTMDAVLFGSHEKLTSAVAAELQKMIDRYKLGAQIVSVTVQGAEPPEQVQPAFDDVMKASQDAQRAIDEARAGTADMVARAKSTAVRQSQEAEAYRTTVVEQAEGDAERFKQVLAEYQKAPGVTRDRMYLETMQQIFTNTTKVMVDSKNGNSLIYLPIDKLLAQSQNNGDGPKGTVTITTPTPTPSPEAAQPQAQPQAPPADMNQAIDSQRARDARARDTRERESR